MARAKKVKMTVTKGGAKIDAVMNEWLESGSVISAYVVSVRAAKKLSNDSLFNLAAFMKYSFGNSLQGESDDDWMQSARDAAKVLGVR